jgi:multiple sugar transport system permease protein
MPETYVKRPQRAALYAAVLLGAAVMLFPFLWTVITSITPAEH